MTRLSARLPSLIAILAAFSVSGVPVAAFAHEAPPTPIVKAQKERPVIEVAFVLDTTGSMSGLIEGAKKKIWSIASRIAQGTPTPILRVGLVGYRDNGDAYVTKRFDLTDDLDAIYGHLQGFSANGGGDTPEHVGRALGEAVKHFSWSQNRRTLKMVFLVGDAPPQVYGDGWNYKEWAKKAIARDIIVNTVRCGGMASTEAAFREIANLADGSFATIDGSGGMMATTTPYDAEISKLSGEITSTVRYAGGESERQAAKVATDALAELDDESAADRAGYLVARKSGGAPAAAAPRVHGAIDIVSATPAQVATLKDADLPPELRRLSAAKRTAEVRKLQAKRADLEKRLVKLTEKRNGYLKAQAAAAAAPADSFDAEVMDAVKTRAADIGVAY